MSLISIGKAAKAYGVHTDTLRNWEKQGKIKSIRTKGNHRRYDEQDIQQCKMMAFCDELGSDEQKCNKWYVFFMANNPTASAALDYSKRYNLTGIHLLQFLIIVILKDASERVTRDWTNLEKADKDA